MDLKEKILEESDSWEGPDPTFTGKHEWSFVFYSTLAYIFFIILDELEWHNSNAEPISWANIIYLTVIAAISFVPILALATKSGADAVKRLIQNKSGILLTVGAIGFMGIFFLLGVVMSTPKHELAVSELESLFFSNSPWWLNLCILLVLSFLCLQLPFFLNKARSETGGIAALWEKKGVYKWLWITLFALIFTSPLYGLIWNLGWLSLLIPLVPILIFLLSQLKPSKQNQKGLNFSDFLCYSFSALIMIITPYIPYSFNLSVIWAIIVIMYATRLGREHFYYSYIPRSSDLKSLIDMVLIAMAVFIPLSILVGFIDLSNFTLDVGFVTLYRDVIIWTFYVGVTEEVIFRCGLLTWISDSIIYHAADAESRSAENQNIFDKIWLKIQNRPKTWGLIISSLLFGISHVPKGIDYGFLAIIAGFTYGLLYQKGKNMFGPILLHMTVDVIAVAFFGAQL